MSRLEELISVLCPNGTEYKAVGEIATVTAGNSAPQKQELFIDGSHPFCRAADVGKVRKSVDFKEISDKLNDEGIKGLRLFPKGSILIPKSGASTLSNNKVRLAIDSYVVSHLAVIIPHEEIINSRFLYYAIEGFDMVALVEDKSYPSVKPSKIADSIIVPVPPIEVQSEIVRILDNFTEHTAELIAELTAELTARKKQYEYYRDSLLTFGTEIDYKELGEVATFKTGSKPKEILEEEGEYEYINAGTTNSGYVSDSNFVADTVTTPSRGQGGIGFVGYQTKPFWLGPLCYGIRSNDEDRLINRYLYYCLCVQKQDILSRKNEGGVPALNGRDLATIIIPVPSKTVQERIVNVLDNFETICSDLSLSLPAEIEARKKQYEYYRDKLYNFTGRDAT